MNPFGLTQSLTNFSATPHRSSNRDELGDICIPAPTYTLTPFSKQVLNRERGMVPQQVVAQLREL